MLIPIISIGDWLIELGEDANHVAREKRPRTAGTNRFPRPDVGMPAVGTSSTAGVQSALPCMGRPYRAMPLYSRFGNCPVAAARRLVKLNIAATSAISQTSSSVKPKTF